MSDDPGEARAAPATLKAGALAVGAGLAISFGEAYVSAGLGVGGWPVKIALLVLVMGPQLRGASEAVSLTVVIGIAALLILVLIYEG